MIENVSKLAVIDRISFCVPNKGRLAHLKQTVRKNIEANAEVPGIEWVLVNLDCPDGMEAWVQAELKEYIDRGLVSYYRHVGPYTPYRYAHADNSAMLLGSGEVISYLPGDNFCPKGYCWTVRQLLGQDRRRVVHFKGVHRGSTGRLTLHKSSFLALGGYNEQMQYWGFQDLDFFARAERAGYSTGVVPSAFAGCLDHDKASRSQFTDGGNALSADAGHARNQAAAAALRRTGGTVANSGVRWGVGTYERNFSGRQVCIGLPEEPR